MLHPPHSLFQCKSVWEGTRCRFVFQSPTVCVFFFHLLTIIFIFYKSSLATMKLEENATTTPLSVSMKIWMGKGARCVFVFHPPTVWFVFLIIEYCFYFLQVFFGHENATSNPHYFSVGGRVVDDFFYPPQKSCLVKWHLRL